MPCASTSLHQPGRRRSPALCDDLYVNLAEPLLNCNVSRLKGTAMSEDRICIARDGGVAHVDLAPEDKFNADSTWAKPQSRAMQVRSSLMAGPFNRLSIDWKRT